ASCRRRLLRRAVRDRLDLVDRVRPAGPALAGPDGQRAGAASRAVAGDRGGVSAETVAPADCYRNAEGLGGADGPAAADAVICVGHLAGIGPALRGGVV